MQALQEVCDVVYLERNPYPSWWNRAGRLFLKVTGGKVDPRMISGLVRFASAPARKRLLASGADWYVSFAASGMAAFLPDNARHIMCSDATSKAIIGYYQQFSHLLPALRNQFIAMESEAMRKAAVLSYPSQWAKDSANRDFSGIEDKAVLIPWGPNMAMVQDRPARELDQGPLKLLFVGVDWERKGGAIALDAVRRLNADGCACHLDVVGVSEQMGTHDLPGNVTFHGRLDKSEPAEAALLEQLYAQAHLFILPTRAEALGMVFAESAAMGLPSLSYATGGVTTVVRDGETGILLDLSAGAAQFAQAIRALAGDPARYAAMSRAALADSRERLNWAVWARQMAQLME